MCRTESAWKRWLWDILEGETASSAPDRRQPPHAAEDGMLVFVSLLTIVFFLALVALLGNVGRTVNQKIEVQNTADAVAQSGALWIARGLNSITATNHLTGELMSFVILLDAIGVRGNSTVDQDTRDQANALALVVKLAQKAKTGTYAYDQYVHLDPLGNGGPLVQTYQPDDAKGDPPPSTVTTGKKSLLKAFNSIYGAKVVAAALENIPFPPAVIAGYALDFIALAVELYALAEWIVLDVVEAVARPLLNGDGNIRDVIFGASPGEGLLAASVKYTRRIHDTVGTQNQQPGLVDRSAAAIGALNQCDAAVLWGAQDLPIAPESFDPNGSDTQFASSQLVRTTWPWVVYHRRPILHWTAWMRLSRTPILYQRYTTAYALTTCRQFYTTHQLYLYVIDDPGNPGADQDKGKGHESWATDSDRAAYLFGVLGFAHRPLPTPFGSRVFGQANANGITTCAQAFVYNANRQEPDNHGPKLQPMVGWDTLNWSAPVNNANAYEHPNDPGGVKNLYNDKTAAPRVYLNWQTMLVPVSSKALTNVLPRLPDKFRSAFNPSDPLPLSFRTH